MILGLSFCGVALEQQKGIHWHLTWKAGRQRRKEISLISSNPSHTAKREEYACIDCLRYHHHSAQWGGKREGIQKGKRGSWESRDLTYQGEECRKVLIQIIVLTEMIGHTTDRIKKEIYVK